MSNARLIAVNALYKINKDKAFSNLALDSLFSGESIDSKDKALATALVYGVLDRKITIDYVIGRLSKTPVKKLSPLTAEALRTGVYQILFMERIPDSAAVNESVNIIKHSTERRNAGFVNAVLRNLIRNPVKLPDGEGIYDLSVRFSCPEWIIKEFLSDYGREDTIKLLEASLMPPPVIIRVNTLKTNEEELIRLLNEEGISVGRSELDGALEIKGGISVKDSELYKKGYYFVQDTASQTVVNTLNPQPGERLLDVCAAPGGKSFTAAILMNNEGTVTACDIYPQRVSLVEKGAERLGLNIITAKVNNALLKNEEFSEFDAVLCDVPCSGLGIIRRKPDIKYNKAENLSEIEKIQRTIIRNSAQYLKPGGRILYSTCTLRKAENENAVTGFLKENPNFELLYQHTFMPHRDNTDGFFCALMRNNPLRR